MCGINSDHHHGPSSEVGIDLRQQHDLTASLNRKLLDAHGVTCFNLMSGPGAGKTSLLEATLKALQGERRAGVLEGDMTTELDAERLRACGVPVVAITTGRACHLDADLVKTGLEGLELSKLNTLFIENVGNLVCPAEFPLGEHKKVVLVSVTEGEDKPLKYPLMFHEADCVVITKTDLSPFVRVDTEALRRNIGQINPKAQVFAVSAETGEGLSEWLGWLEAVSTKREPVSSA